MTSPPILMMGGQSALGMHLRQLLPASTICYSRPPPISKNEVQIADYSDLPSEAMENTKVTINLIGAARGSVEELTYLNAELPVQLAVKAKAAGVDQFVHISSFSVFGSEQNIARETLAVPTTAYGMTKKIGEDRLLALADRDFKLSILRLPMLYDLHSPSKLQQMIFLWKRLGFLPVPAKKVQRSMMHYMLAAQVVKYVCENEIEGVHAAADPVPFDFSQARQKILLEHPGRWGMLALPFWIFYPLKLFRPDIYRSYCRYNVLSDNANLAVQAELDSRLYKDIRSIPSMTWPRNGLS
ncbi:sugar nucleotide-binding protein [Parasphingorhabdus sp.]|uniref:sugar nucleotide-binding protein n=1 Tax=Parasphingorhabdus sp. TaxID=2709688 RepID=UPI0030031D4C